MKLLSRLLFIIYVILLHYTEAKLRIAITVASLKEDVKFEYKGHSISAISEIEKKLFNVTLENLRRGVRIELGAVPKDVYLDDPTPFNNVFQKYDWKPVKRKVEVKSAKVIVIENERVNLKVSEHNNNTTLTVKAKINGLVNVHHIVSSWWSKNGLPEDETNYNVKVNLQSNSFEYKNKWRNGKARGFHLPFGDSDEGYIEIPSGNTIRSTLSAYKTLIVAEIKFAASLNGSVVVDFDTLHGGYHLYAPSVKNIMRAGNLTNEIITSEFIEIRCYTDPKLEIIDEATGRSPKIIKPLKDFRRRYKPRNKL